jgi:hypothetical protein
VSERKARLVRKGVLPVLSPELKKELHDRVCVIAAKRSDDVAQARKDRDVAVKTVYGDHYERIGKIDAAYKAQKEEIKAELMSR